LIAENAGRLCIRRIIEQLARMMSMPDFVRACSNSSGKGVVYGVIPVGASPAHQVSKPRRPPSPRRALTAHGLAEINAVARTSGNDAALDALLLRVAHRNRVPARGEP
jgi:hypothetical protein